MDALIFGSINLEYRVQYERDGCFGAVGLETSLVSGLWFLLGNLGEVPSVTIGASLGQS